VGFYDETAAYAPNASEKFFQRLSETNGTPGKPFYMPNGTPFFCTASGVLLKKGLTDWDKLPETDRKPGALKVPKYTVDSERLAKARRLAKPPVNGLILRTYVRGLKPDEKGRLCGPRIIPEMYNKRKGRPLSRPVRKRVTPSPYRMSCAIASATGTSRAATTVCPVTTGRTISGLKR
jgi:hypothetical protein